MHFCTVYMQHVDHRPNRQLRDAPVLITGTSGQRYRNITLTCGRGWIRCRCVRPHKAGVRQTIMSPGATDGLSQFSSGCSQLEFELQFQLEIRCRSENQLQTEGLGPQDPGWAAQQNKEEVLLWSEELWVNMWQSLSVSNSPLTHNRHQPFRNAFANKVWEVYFL